MACTAWSSHTPVRLTSDDRGFQRARRLRRSQDQIANGEDFELNRWRCLETPDRACGLLTGDVCVTRGLPCEDVVCHAWKLSNS